jgi:hypothetical protein
MKPISSNMNNDGFTDLIALKHEPGASVRAFKTKEYDPRPNRNIQNRIHLFAQEMLYLVHGTCLCMAVAVLLLVGGAVMLTVQIGTKIVEGFELMLAASPGIWRSHQTVHGPTYLTPNQIRFRSSTLAPMP